MSEVNQGSQYNVNQAGVKGSNEGGSVMDLGSSGKIGDGKGTVRLNFNRFSHFVKTGGEAYILGSMKVNANHKDQIQIIETSEGVIWIPNPQPYFCSVASPKKETKLKGLFKLFHLYSDHYFLLNFFSPYD